MPTLPSGLSALALSKRCPSYLEQSIFSFSTLSLESLIASMRKTPLIGLDAGCLNRVAGIVMSEVQRATAGASTSTAKASRSGGVLFVLRFGATLNADVDLHFCMLDGVVVPGRQGLAFRGAQVDEACVERVQGLVRQRVLGLFERRGLLSRETVVVMQGWGYSGGFSVHAGVRVAAQDSAGRERLLRYCARPIFAGERLV